MYPLKLCKKSDYALRLDVHCFFWMWYIVIYTSLCESIILHLGSVITGYQNAIVPRPSFSGLQVSEIMYFECVVDS